MPFFFSKDDDAEEINADGEGEDEVQIEGNQSHQAEGDAAEFEGEQSADVDANNHATEFSSTIVKDQLHQRKVESFVESAS